MRKVIPVKNKRKTAEPTRIMPNYKEFLWYKEHEQALLAQYAGRYIVIKAEKVIAVFDSKNQAWEDTIETHQPGSFIIHHCAPVDARRLPRIANRHFFTVQNG